MRLTNIIEYTVTVYCVAIFWTNVVTLAIIFKYTRTVFLQITYTICYDGKMMSVLNRELDLHVVGLRCPADTDAANIREQVTRSEGRRQEMSSGKWVTARRRRRRRLNIHSRLRLQGKYAPDYIGNSVTRRNVIMTPADDFDARVWRQITIKSHPQWVEETLDIRNP